MFCANNIEYLERMNNNNGAINVLSARLYALLRIEY